MEENSTMSHLDRVINLFTSPKDLFEDISVNGPKITDWLLPFVLTIFITISASFFYMSNDALRYYMQDKQIKKAYTYIDSQVANGKISKSDAVSQKETTAKQISEGFEKAKSPIFLIFQFVAAFIAALIVLMVVTSYYYLGCRFLSKNTEVKFASVLSILGICSYITLIEQIFAIMFTLILSKVLTGISVASFLDDTTNSNLLYFAGKIAPFTLISYFLIGLGLSKVFRMSYAKAYAFVFGSWVFFGLFFFALTRVFPFLSNFGM